MSRFTADYSSSIGSSVTETPPPAKSKDVFFDEPQVASTTPIVPPPSIVFGSSRLGTGRSKPLFQRSSPASTRQAPSSQRQYFQTNNKASSAKPKSQLVQTAYNDSVGSTYPDNAQDDTFGEEMDEEPSFVGRANATSLMRFSINSPKTSLARSARRQPEPNPSHLPHKGQANLVPGLARDLGARAKPAAVERNDDM
ncbi:MAG: hypothetical protein M1823_007375, partial [Watsoniomyces obsoletus]